MNASKPRKILGNAKIMEYSSRCSDPPSVGGGPRRRSKKIPLFLRKLIESFFFSDVDKLRLVFLNGEFLKTISEIKDCPKGVVLKNEDGGVLLSVPDDTCLRVTPIHILFFVSVEEKGGTKVSPHLNFSLGERSSVSVVVEHVWLKDGPSSSEAVSHFSLAKGSNLDYTEIHHGREKVTGFFKNKFELEEASCLKTHFFSHGGDRMCRENAVHLAAPSAFASLRGFSLLSSHSQVVDEVTVWHARPSGTSRQVFKSILGDKAKSEFDSLVRVDQTAPKSDSSQLSQSLLLSDEAAAFSRPKLRIDNDDVQCKHGATVGRLEKEELFYLQSRGLSKKEARFVMTYGFVQEMLSELNLLPLRNRLQNFVSDELSKMLGGEKLEG